MMLRDRSWRRKSKKVQIFGRVHYARKSKDGRDYSFQMGFKIQGSEMTSGGGGLIKASQEAQDMTNKHFKECFGNFLKDEAIEILEAMKQKLAENGIDEGEFQAAIDALTAKERALMAEDLPDYPPDSDGDY